MRKQKRVVNKQYFLTNLEALKMNQREFADKLGVDRSAVHHLLYGRRKPKASEVVVIAEMFGVHESTVLYNFGARPNDAGPEELLTANVTDYATGDNMKIVAAKTDTPVVVPKGISAKTCRILQIKNPAGFMHDWKMFYYPADRVASGALHQMCVVKREGETSLYLRQVNSGSGVGRYNLVNPLAPDQTETDVVLHSAAPIVAIRY